MLRIRDAEEQIRAQDQSKRHLQLVKDFQEFFPDAVEVSIARAPGRINIIGEHIDYSGFSVLPIAIDRDILVAFSPREDRKICLANVQPRYPASEFEISSEISPSSQGHWSNYIKAAAAGLIGDGIIDPDSMPGMNMLFSGSIPPAVGLSSSSAVVVASAIAILSMAGVEMEKNALADLLSKAERYVGTQGGGMDQAISLLAEGGYALKIDFFPLRAEPIKVAADFCFIAASTMIHAGKSDNARRLYNTRAAESRLAAKMLAHACSKELGRKISARIPSDITPKKTGLSWDEILKIGTSTITDRSLSLEQIAAFIESTADSLRGDCLSRKAGGFVEEPREGFQIYRRLVHIIGEIRRVVRAVDGFQKGDIATVGRLLNESHESLRRNYEVSCPELDLMVQIAQDIGAAGSRLTGGGFGGCTINLVKVEQSADFIKEMKHRYYREFLSKEHPQLYRQITDYNNVIFPCRPSAGAGIVF